MTGNMAGVFCDSVFRWWNRRKSPVGFVSYNEVVAFIDRLNDQQAGSIQNGWEYALPTEAQWEYARRAGSTSVWGSFDVSDPL